MADSQITRMVEALTAEFTDTVVFTPTLPSTVDAPSVVVAPGTPFIEPSTVTPGVLEERWDVLCAVSVKEPKPGIDQMRNLSLRVRRAVLSVGATWHSASGPQRLAGMGEQTQIVVAVNTVTFRYDPAQHLGP